MPKKRISREGVRNRMHWECVAYLFVALILGFSIGAGMPPPIISLLLMTGLFIFHTVCMYVRLRWLDSFAWSRQKEDELVEWTYFENTFRWALVGIYVGIVPGWILQDAQLLVKGGSVGMLSVLIYRFEYGREK